MMRIALILASLLVGTAIAAEPPCQELFAKTERKLPWWARSFDSRPIIRPRSVSSADLLQVELSQTRELEKMGVDFTELPIATTVVRSKAKIVDKPGKKGSTGKVLQLHSLPKPHQTGTFQTPALYHPEMAAYLKRVEALGAKLVVDTSLPLSGAGAFYNSYFGIIALRPNSNWSTFIHEFQHLEFFLYVKKYFAEARGPHGSTFGDPHKIDFVKAHPELVKNISAERVRRIQELLKSGVKDVTSINEALSGDAELALMGWRRHAPGSAVRTKQYALKYQIEEHLGKDNIDAAKSAILRHHGLSIYEASPGIGIVTAGVGGFVGTVYALAPEKRSDFEKKYDAHGLRLDNGDVLFRQRFTNLWDCLKCRPGSPHAEGYDRIDSKENGERIGYRYNQAPFSLGYLGYEKIVRNIMGEVYGVRRDSSQVFLRKDELPAPPVKQLHYEVCQDAPRMGENCRRPSSYPESRP